MLHFAVNRPAGACAVRAIWRRSCPGSSGIRGGWRIGLGLNAAVRAFLWIVKVAEGECCHAEARVAGAAGAGRVQVIDRDSEEWPAVAPTLHANDAPADGRAIRWMVAAGGPGTALTDFGEAETANLATATAMAEQRTRFLKARQGYFGYLLARVGLESYNRAVRLGRVRGKRRIGGHSDRVLGRVDGGQRGAGHERGECGAARCGRCTRWA